MALYSHVLNVHVAMGSSYGAVIYSEAVGGAKHVHWGSDFTWPCVVGCNMNPRHHPVYMSAFKDTVTEWPTWLPYSHCSYSLQRRGKYCENLQSCALHSAE